MTTLTPTVNDDVDSFDGLLAEERRAEPIIRLRDITKSYTMGDMTLQVLKGISFDIYPGEFVAIMGPSGSGKSTLMNILGALDQPTSGQYFIDGEDVARLGERRLAGVRNRKIGFIFQSYNLLKRTTAQRQVELPLIYAGAGGRGEKARRALQAVGLGERMDHLPTELSGGQQQRVAIARALVNNPTMILADEATGNLDSKSGTEVMQILQRLNREQGITIVFVTHDAWTARHMKRLIMLRDGLLVADQRIQQPLVAGESERPSELAELEGIFNQVYDNDNGAAQPAPDGAAEAGA